MNRAELVEQIARALGNSDLGDFPTGRAAEVALAIALPEGPYGLCSSADCRNPATVNSGLRICKVCAENISFGSALALANSEISRFGEVVSEGWMDRIEAKIRGNATTA